MAPVTPEPRGPRPAVWGASGDVWQRGTDRLWRRTGDPDGRTWFEVEIIDRPLVPIPAPLGQAPYTDELPTIDLPRLDPRRALA